MTTPNFRLPQTNCVPCAAARAYAVQTSQKILTEKMAKAVERFMNLPAPPVERSEESVPKNPSHDV